MSLIETLTFVVVGYLIVGFVLLKWLDREQRKENKSPSH